MKLSIIVTRWKEPWEVCHYLFDSIAIQRGIDLDDIEVVVVNDGKEDLLDEAIFVEYPFKVRYLPKEHGGVSAARNFGLDNAKGEYVMFADCDDMFLNNYGLHLVFGAMNEGFETLISAFIEEQKVENEDGSLTWRIINHDKDVTFIHGKVHNRAFLIANDLRFNENLTVHEDGFFNTLVTTIATNRRVVSTPFYLWRWNDESTVRKDREDYLLKTYSNLMDCRKAMCDELNERGYINDFIDCVVKTVFDSYYDFQKPNALNPKNKKLVEAAEKAFRSFYLKYADVYKECAIQRVAELMCMSRTNAFMNGLRVEQKTITEWLTHIMTEVKNEVAEGDYLSKLHEDIIQKLSGFVAEQ